MPNIEKCQNEIWVNILIHILQNLLVIGVPKWAENDGAVVYC